MLCCVTNSVFLSGVCLQMSPVPFFLCRAMRLLRTTIRAYMVRFPPQHTPST